MQSPGSSANCTRASVRPSVADTSRIPSRCAGHSGSPFGHLRPLLPGGIGADAEALRYRGIALKSPPGHFRRPMSAEAGATEEMGDARRDGAGLPAGPDGWRVRIVDRRDPRRPPGPARATRRARDVTIPDPRQIVIRPWDPKSLRSIGTAISQSRIGLTPTIDGSTIRLYVPALSEERRRELVGIVHKRMDQARVEIRAVRHEALAAVRARDPKRPVASDDVHRETALLQRLTDRFIGEDRSPRSGQGGERPPAMTRAGRARSPAWCRAPGPAEPALRPGA